MSRIATLSKKTDKTQNVQVTRKCGGRPVPVGVPGGAAPCPNKGKPCPPCTRGKPPVPTTSRTQISRRNVSTGLGKSLAHVRPSDEGLEVSRNSEDLKITRPYPRPRRYCKKGCLNKLSLNQCENQDRKCRSLANRC